MQKNIFELKNISYQIEDKIILKDINLSFQNEFIVITGPNGSGKSTLAKICAGIIKPTSGSIFFNGQDITDENITKRAKMGISFGFQQPVTFKGLKVKDLITLAKGGKATFNEICDVLSNVGLCAKDYVNRDLDNSLSGGELKRIEIAMIMARKSTISIFDEPEAGIDLWSFQRLIKVFEDMMVEKDSAIIIISHQEKILNIANKIVYLVNGVVTEFDDKEKVLPKIINKTSSACVKLINK